MKLLEQDEAIFPDCVVENRRKDIMNSKKVVLAEAELCVLDVYERETDQPVHGAACANQSIPHPEVVILEIREEARSRCNPLMQRILGHKQTLTVILTSYANQDLGLWFAEARIFHPSRLARLKRALQEATRSDSARRAVGSLVGQRGNGNAL